jgi:hypothetical protein
MHWGSVQAVRPIRGEEVQLYSFMTTALEGGERSAARPGRSLPTGMTRYPLYRRLGGPQGRSGQVRKDSTPQGFDPRTVQPVARRYTVYATRHKMSARIRPISTTHMPSPRVQGQFYHQSVKPSPAVGLLYTSGPQYELTRTQTGFLTTL